MRAWIAALLVTGWAVAEPIRFPPQGSLPGIYLELSGSWQGKPPMFTSSRQQWVGALVKGAPGLADATTYQKLMLTVTRPTPKEKLSKLQVGGNPAVILRDPGSFLIYVGGKDVSATIQGACKAGESCEPLISEICKSFRWESK